MAATYSLATSPLTRSTPIPFSTKRVPSGRSSGALPVPGSQARLSGAGAVALDGLEGGRDDWHQRYSLSTSGRRRSVASGSPSNTGSSEAKNVVMASNNVTVGFSVGASSSAFSDASSFSFPARSAPAGPVARPPRTGVSLLSRALSTGEKVGPEARSVFQRQLGSSLPLFYLSQEQDLLAHLPPVLPSTDAADPLLFFPGIPLELLREAQVCNLVCMGLQDSGWLGLRRARLSGMLRGNLGCCNSSSLDVGCAIPAAINRPFLRGPGQAEFPIFNNELLVHAYGLAARAHQNQQRKNGESLLSHCVAVSCCGVGWCGRVRVAMASRGLPRHSNLTHGFIGYTRQVAKTVAGLGLDAETVAAALLHECVDMVSRSQLEEFMPPSVVSVLEHVNTISEMSRLYRQHSATGSFSDETFQRLLVGFEDVKAVIVKLSDRLAELRTISVLPADRQAALARETLEVYSVVANRLGVWCLKAELEDLAFSVLHPQVRGACAGSFLCMIRDARV